MRSYMAEGRAAYIAFLNLRAAYDLTPRSWSGRPCTKPYWMATSDRQLHLLNTAVYRHAYSLHIVGLVQFNNYITVHFKTMSLNSPWGLSQHWCGTSSVKSVNVVLLLMPNRRWCMNSLASSTCVRLSMSLCNFSFVIVLICASDVDILFRRSRLRLCSEQGGYVHMSI